MNVDWYDCWLNAREDPDLAKRANTDDADVNCVSATDKVTPASE